MTKVQAIHWANLNREWVIRAPKSLVSAKPIQGQTITVSRKDGSSSTETVAGAYDDGDAWIIHPAPKPKPAKAKTAYKSRSRYHQDGDSGFKPVRGCSTCSSLGRMCKQCQFDEY